MPARPLDRETARRAIELVAQYGEISKAAHALGISPSTFDRWFRAGIHRYGFEDPRNAQKQILDEAPEPPTTVERAPVEVHDAAFWKRKATEAQKRLGEAERVCEELAGFFDLPFELPSWLAAGKDEVSGRSVIGCFVSDVHMGEVVSPDEIIGINAFDPDICRKRLERYFRASVTIGKRWAVDTDLQGAVLFLGGDMISGSIHDELTRTNALTSQEQVLAVVECLSAGIKLLLEHYGRVHVAAVPGNHGRTTLKSTAKLYARLSYDIMIANILRERFIDDDRVTFQVGDSKDQIVPLFGRTVFLTHGDKMGTGGGMGFAGPLLPIVRGTKKIQAQQARLNRRPDLVLHAHYHTIANPGPVLSNGSVVGYSEYADDIRGEPEPPAQWLFLFHERWGLRERMPILLEDPAPPEKPIVRIPVGMARARA